MKTPAPVLTAGDLPPGAIILTRGEGIFSDGIDALTTDGDPTTDDHWSHAAMVIKIYDGQINVLQAVGHGVEMPDFNIFRQSLVNPALVLYPRQSVNPDFIAMNMFALSMQGAPYAAVGIRNFLVDIIAGVDLSECTDDIVPEKLFCSQAVCWLWKIHQKLDLVPGEPNHLVSPNDIARSLDVLEPLGFILPIVWPPKIEELDDDEVENFFDED